MSRRTQRAKASETTRQEQAMLGALQRHARHPVHLELDVSTGQLLVAALQLAMRHPAFPSTSRRILQDFVRAWQRQIAQHDVALALMTEMGNKPQHDVALPPCRWCGVALEDHTRQDSEWLCAGGRRAYAPAED